LIKKKVYERKCRKSWLIGSNAKFIHHAIEHPHPDLLQHFFAVQDGQSTTTTPSFSSSILKVQQQRPSIVCHWRVEESDLKNMIKKEVFDFRFFSSFFFNDNKKRRFSFELDSFFFLVFSFVISFFKDQFIQFIVRNQ
jgi:hypothetical protein